MDYTHCRFYCASGGSAGGDCAIGEYPDYGDAGECAADSICDDLQRHVRSHGGGYLAHYGEIGGNRAAVGTDSVYCPGEYCARAGMAFPGKQGYGKMVCIRDGSPGDSGAGQISDAVSGNHQSGGSASAASAGAQGIGDFRDVFPATADYGAAGRCGCAAGDSCGETGFYEILIFYVLFGIVYPWATGLND